MPDVSSSSALNDLGEPILFGVATVATCERDVELNPLIFKGRCDNGSVM